MKPLRLLLSCLLFGGLYACSDPPETPASVDFLRAGDSLSQKTYDTLAASLRQAITTGGFENAIEVCKDMAPALTAGTPDAETQIRRTALKVRNQANKADHLELAQLEYFSKVVHNTDSLKARLVVDHTGTVHYFKPIIMQPLCLSCHGTPADDIAAATLAKIQQKYPADAAVGFKPGDLRGMWHITFNPFFKAENQ